jgi:hypothetical protein
MDYFKILFDNAGGFTLSSNKFFDFMGGLFKGNFLINITK